MRAEEFLIEYTRGVYGKGGITPTRGKAYRTRSKIAYEIRKSIMNAETAKEKLDILMNLKKGQTTNYPVFKIDGKNFRVKKWDKETGTITVTDPKNIYLINDNDMEFVGPERSISNTSKQWVFQASDMKVKKKEIVRKPKPEKVEPEKTDDEPRKMGTGDDPFSRMQAKFLAMRPR